MDHTRIELDMTDHRSINNPTQLRRLFEEARSRLRLAEGLLACLTEARAECESQLTRLQKSDAVRDVTGTSSIEERIAQTKRMVESLRRVVEELGERIGTDHHSLATC
jgi:hypothetical protein